MDRVLVFGTSGASSNLAGGTNNCLLSYLIDKHLDKINNLLEKNWVLIFLKKQAILQTHNKVNEHV